MATRLTTTIRLILSALIAVAGLAWLAPWALYELALANIDGRPSAPELPQIRPEDEVFLRDHLKAQRGFSLVRLSPVTYLFTLATPDPEGSAEEGGAVATWMVARNYNSTHLRNKKMLWWHLSGAALTIWLTRNWTLEQILSKAAEVTRQRAERGKSATGVNPL